MLKTLILAISLLTLGACTSSAIKSKTELSAEAKSAGIRCEKSVKVGSHIGKRRCTTKKQRKLEKESAAELMERNQRTGPSTRGSGGP